MTKLIRVFAVLLALAVVAVWIGLGADRGWTKTMIAVPRTDPVTEIAFVEYEPGFVPGVDFLAAGLAGAAALFVITLFPFTKPQSKNS